jgi:sarcosine oxidase, subunit alpha
MSRAGPYRLPQRGGSAPVVFRFDGKTVQGMRGDTVASALLANGVRVVSRSFKYHRPRGIFSAGFEEPNALVQLHEGEHAIPCARATLVPLAEGLQVTSEVGWPSVSFDALRAIDFAHSIFAAGFYNRTFMWPNWHTYEPLIRRMAGFGRSPTGPDPDRYEERHAHCDVLVVGGGAAGMAAAVAAAVSGERVLLVEQGAELGDNGAPLAGAPNVEILLRTTAFGYYDHEMLGLAERLNDGENPAGRLVARTPTSRERLWLVRAKRVVLATGSIEQPLIFCNNDRPGIMLAGSALAYLRRHGIAPGHQVVIATNNDTAYAVADELRAAGVHISALVDSRPSPSPALLREMQKLNIPVHAGSLPIDTRGFGALKQVKVATLNPQTGVSQPRSLACDALLVSGGWSPTLHLFAQAGGKLAYSATERTFKPIADHPHIDIVGSATEPPAGELGERVSPVGNKARQWVDLRHDVTVADIELSVRENFTAVEHIKRYTTLGMSVDQGKLGQAPAVEIIARARGQQPIDLGHTTFRPPFVPITIGTLVGRQVGDFYAPARRTPLYSQQVSSKALFEDFGEWQRAAVFPRPGESREQAVSGEVQLVRKGVGLYDASPLGKIELAGPDALAFADRFYISNLLTLEPGRARYSLMLRESGVIFDDGTIVVLDDDRVLLTTTSSGAGRVAGWLEEWRQCEWPDLRVVVCPVTEQWATLALTGQHARTILERLKPKCDLSNQAFPHLGFRTTQLLGSEARLYRVSFSGELTYEINVPAHKAAALWSALLEEGRRFNIAPFGVDALLHMRMEKGFLHVGADTDGTTVPDDVGFGKPAAAKQTHYVGKRSLTLPENVRPDRLQLVGLSGDASVAMPVGSHLRLPDSREATDGWITSAGFLSTDGRPVAMAMLRGGRSQMSKTITVHDNGQVVTRAKVVQPLFYDPAGARMHA